MVRGNLQKAKMIMQTKIISKQRISKISHDAIKKKALREFRTQQSVIREILDNWAKEIEKNN